MALGISTIPEINSQYIVVYINTKIKISIPLFCFTHKFQISLYDKRQKASQV